MRRRALFISGILGAFAHCGVARGQGAASYAIVDVGDFGGRSATIPRAINNNGVIAGTTWDAQSNEIRVFVWRNGVVEYLEPLVPGLDARANDINDLDEIAGYSYTALGARHAVKWLADGTPVDLGTLGGEDSGAYGISASGQVVGGADLPVEGSHSFLWEKGRMIDLGDLGRPSGGANAINEVGQIVGASGILPFSSRAFLWENGEMINLGTLPDGSQSIAYDINDVGVIAGEASNSSSLRNAVLWENRIIRNINNPSLGRYTGAYAINASGQVVGYIDVDFTLEQLQSFFYEDPGPMVDLRSLLPAHHTWRQLLVSLDINDHGEIIAYGDRVGGSDYLYHAVLITPVHPTLTLQGPQPGTAGTLNGIRATGCTPGARVHFFYSTTGGGTLVPGCNHTDGVTLQLENPIRAGTATANANGIATLTRFIPGNASNLGEVLIQAVDADNCQISQLVAHQFE
ncbi:MAG: DUF3466 family protein [Phycisphaerales bacterium]|nr:DUF3466 family protein [Phycisphaerales bacterium]